MEIYAELYASGNGEEEFWVSNLDLLVHPVGWTSNVQYYNTADAYLGDLPAGSTYGSGPFREVRLLVDGRVAGVAFPYAVIFTGGINPAVWRYAPHASLAHHAFTASQDPLPPTARSTFRRTFWT